MFARLAEHSQNKLFTIQGFTVFKQGEKIERRISLTKNFPLQLCKCTKILISQRSHSIPDSPDFILIIISNNYNMLRIISIPSYSIFMTTQQGRQRISTATQRELQDHTASLRGAKVQPQAQCLACMYPSLYTWHIQKRTFCTTQSKFFYLRSQALATFKIIFRMNHHTSLAGCDYS